MLSWNHVINAVVLAVTVITVSKIHRQRYPLSPLNSAFQRRDESSEVENGGEKTVVDLAASEGCLGNIFPSWQKDYFIETLSVTVKSTLLESMPKTRLETFKDTWSPEALQGGQLACAVTSINGGKSQSKYKCERLLPLTIKKIVYPHLCTLFCGGKIIDLSVLPIQEDVFLAHFCTLSSSNTL